MIYRYWNIAWVKIRSCKKYYVINDYESTGLLHITYATKNVIVAMEKLTIEAINNFQWKSSVQIVILFLDFAKKGTLKGLW